MFKTESKSLFIVNVEIFNESREGSSSASASRKEGMVKGVPRNLLGQVMGV